MINEDEIFGYFASAIESGELSFNEMYKAAEFLEKYHFEKKGEDGEEAVTIIDDIKS